MFLLYVSAKQFLLHFLSANIHWPAIKSNEHAAN